MGSVRGISLPIIVAVPVLAGCGVLDKALLGSAGSMLSLGPSFALLCMLAGTLAVSWGVPHAARRAVSGQREQAQRDAEQLPVEVTEEYHATGGQDQAPEQAD